MQGVQKIIVVDLGSQYTQLIARRFREINVFSEIRDSGITSKQILEEKPIGIVLSGGPASVYERGSPKIEKDILHLGIPVLGICYGLQLITHMLGGEVKRAEAKEYGKTELFVTAPDSLLFKGLNPELLCWMSHADQVVKLPSGFTVTSKTFNTPVTSIENQQAKIFGVQFHPEVTHTPWGIELLRNFAYDICQAKGDWKVTSIIEDAIQSVREQARDKRVLCAISGGIDSLTTAVLVQRAIGQQLYCIFVDHGLMRLGEADQVEAVFQKRFKANFKRVNAQKRFLTKLRGVSDPEKKRKIIGSEFIRIFEEEARKTKGISFIAQGTIYPDVIESRGIAGHARVIKSHHNVGGLPRKMKLKLIEPLRNLFKDEVRKIALELGVPENIVNRQPFPGPGLAIRIIGPVTTQKIQILQRADAIIQEELSRSEVYTDIAQAFGVLPSIKTVGVMGDRRTYGYPIILRIVTTADWMTADWAKIPYPVLERISNRIINEIEGVNRVAYDISSKPPATIEWE